MYACIVRLCARPQCLSPSGEVKSKIYNAYAFLPLSLSLSGFSVRLRLSFVYAQRTSLFENLHAPDGRVKREGHPLFIRIVCMYIHIHIINTYICERAMRSGVHFWFVLTRTRSAPPPPPPRQKSNLFQKKKHFGFHSRTGSAPLRTAVFRRETSQSVSQSFVNVWKMTFLKRLLFNAFPDVDFSETNKANNTTLAGDGRAARRKNA